MQEVNYQLTNLLRRVSYSNVEAAARMKLRIKELQESMATCQRELTTIYDISDENSLSAMVARSTDLRDFYIPRVSDKQNDKDKGTDEGREDDGDDNGDGNRNGNNDDEEGDETEKVMIDYINNYNKTKANAAVKSSRGPQTPMPEGSDHDHNIHDNNKKNNSDSDSDHENNYDKDVTNQYSGIKRSYTGTQYASPDAESIESPKKSRNLHSHGSKVSGNAGGGSGLIEKRTEMSAAKIVYHEIAVEDEDKDDEDDDDEDDEDDKIEKLCIHDDDDDDSDYDVQEMGSPGNYQEEEE